MRLHTALEEVYCAAPKEERLAAYKNLEQFVQFDFGDVSGVSEAEVNGLYKYVEDLIAHNALAFPYDHVCFSFKETYEDGEYVDAAVAVVLMDKTDDSTIFSMFFIGKTSEDPENFLASLTYEVTCGRHPQTQAPGFGVRFTGHCAQYNNKAYEHLHESAWNLTSQVFMMTAMLNAKDVEQRITPPPAKLNKARAKAGRPLIGEIREVVIRVGDRVVRPSGHDTTGGHASPRCHWRRGHVRRLASGKIAHVRPCLVGSIGEPVARGYKVQVG